MLRSNSAGVGRVYLEIARLFGSNLGRSGGREKSKDQCEKG